MRISGQDVERGTFSHRHAVVHDQKSLGDRYCPLRNLGMGQARLISAYLPHISPASPLHLPMYLAYISPHLPTSPVSQAQFDACNSSLSEYALLGLNILRLTPNPNP